MPSIWVFRRIKVQMLGHAMAQAVSCHILTQRPGFMPESLHVGFVMDKVAVGQAFSHCEFFSIPL
jgi:hypothetical protein